MTKQHNCLTDGCIPQPHARIEGDDARTLVKCTECGRTFSITDIDLAAYGSLRAVAQGIPGPFACPIGPK